MYAIWHLIPVEPKFGNFIITHFSIDENDICTIVTKGEFIADNYYAPYGWHELVPKAQMVEVHEFLPEDLRQKGDTAFDLDGDTLIFTFPRPDTANHFFIIGEIVEVE